MLDAKGRELKAGDNVLLFAQVVGHYTEGGEIVLTAGDGTQITVAPGCVCRNNADDINLIDPAEPLGDDEG